MKQLLPLLLPLLFLINCSSGKNLSSKASNDLLKARINEYLHGLNSRDEIALRKMYSIDYESLSPVHKPQEINVFIKDLLTNLTKNNFEVIVQIKEIKASENLAFVTMNWQVKTIGEQNELDPFAKVQRLDIWQKNNSGDWFLFRTVIYNEKAF